MAAAADQNRASGFPLRLGDEVALAQVAGVYRVVLRTEVEGFYVFVFESPTSPFPERDYLYDFLADAKQRAEREYGIAVGDWVRMETSV